MEQTKKQTEREKQIQEAAKEPEMKQDKKPSFVSLWLRAVAFILIAILLLGRVQGILIKKWYYPSFENIYQTVNGIDALGRNQAQVLFLGTSHIEYGIAPIQIYRDTGIITYNMSTAKQSLPNTYYLLKRTFKKQSPKVVVIDASPAFLANDDNSPWRYLLDSMKLDLDKLDMLFNGYRKSENTDGFFTGLFPIMKYHTRWETLSKEDFDPAPKGFYYSGGQYVRAITQPSNVTAEQIENMANLVGEDVYRKTVTEQNKEWIQKIHTLCEKNGAELLFIKIPVAANPADYHSAWSRQRCESMREVLSEQGIAYVDLQFDTDLGIDYQRETVDKGHHLNMFGAVKSTAFMESYLKEHYDLKAEKSEVFEQALPIYEKVWQLGRLHACEDAGEYFDYLAANRPNLTIALSAKKGQAAKLSDATKEEMKKIGIVRLEECGAQDHFGAALYPEGHSWEDKNSAGELVCECEAGGKALKIQCSKKDSNIYYDGEKQQISGDGICMVVIDNATGVAIDSVVISSSEDGQTLIKRDAFDADDRFQLYEDCVSR